jgi:hypothetical protein
VFVFTVLILLVTLGNADRYHLNAPVFGQSVGSWAWFGVYVIVPPIMLIVLVTQYSVAVLTPFGNGRSPRTTVSLSLLGAVALLLGALNLLIDLRAASWIWPWHSTSVTSQAFGVWMIGEGMAQGPMAWEADSKRVRPATDEVGALGVLQLVAVLRYRAELERATGEAWVYIVVLASFVVPGVHE